MASDSEERTTFLELVAFIDATANLNVRREALEYVTGVSVAFDGSASAFFAKYDFAVGRALCNLCEMTASDRTQTMAALTNFTSGSASSADFVLSSSKCTELAFTACTTDVLYASVAARLLANLSRHFPDRVYKKLQKLKADCFKLLLGEVKTSEKVDPLKAQLVGFVIVNFTQLGEVRESLVSAEPAQLSVVYELLKVPTAEVREVAADVLRNLAFDDSLHAVLLDDTDAYLCEVVAPLLDRDDALDDDEMDKLPLRLQYFEGRREGSESVRRKLVEALFQLCATRHGREVLRTRGVYPAMRELDKATTKAADGSDGDAPRLLTSSEQEHTLHALIGILIRYESEMCVDENLHSIRHIQ